VRAELIGVRMHLLVAMIVLALASVVISAVVINHAVDSELADFSRRDLQFSAANAAELAASAYLEEGRWAARPVHALQTIARARGDAVVVLGADGRPVIGAPLSAGGWAVGEHAPVIVHGQRVGTVIASHPRDGGVTSAAKRLDRHLQGRMSGLLLTAGLFAGALALMLALIIALQFVRPLRRLTEAARRMGAGEIETRATGSGGGREMARLAETMDRLAAALRRQDELRRSTAADVSHELRGALSGVVGRVEALRHGLVEDEQAALLQIETDAHRVRRLVDDVGRFAEAQRPGLLVRKRPIDLDAIVHSCVAGYHDRCRALSIELTRRVSPARVVGDPERLAQVVDNLLSNAIRYTDPGGGVAVTLEERGAEAVIEVSDSGIGIAPEHVSRIFDRFWRSPEARARAAEGSGVGLALLSDLVRAHSGRVAVASEPGRGTTFSVFLPSAAPPATAARRATPVGVPDLWRRRGELTPAGTQRDAPLAG